MLKRLTDTSSNTNYIHYIHFFIVHILTNAFYTAKDIAYTSIAALITAPLVSIGGEAVGWRTVTIVYTLIMIVFNMVIVFQKGCLLHITLDSIWWQLFIIINYCKVFNNARPLNEGF